VFTLQPVGVLRQDQQPTTVWTEPMVVKPVEMTDFSYFDKRVEGGMSA
jgi:hypothetical protein